MLWRKGLLVGWLLVAGAAAAQQPAPGAAVSADKSAGAPADAPADVPADDAATGDRPNYVLQIDAPDEIARLIRSQTLVGKWQFRRDYSVDQFDALYGRLDDEIRAILQSLGYFDSTMQLGGDEHAVTVTMNAGARTTVNLVRIDIRGEARELPDTIKRVVDGWQLPEGDFYNANRWALSKRLLLEGLRQRGFLRARISESHARADVVATAISLEVTIDSGPQILFGPLTIKGLSRYDPVIVSGLRAFEPGDPYDFDKLQQFQTRLRDAGYFSAAQVLPDEAALQDDPSLLAVPIRVEVTELQAMRSVLGLGYSTDRGPRAQVGLQHRNLLGRGWQFDSGLIVEQTRQRAYATVTTPAEQDGRYWVGGGRYESTEVQNVSTRTSTVFVGQGRRRERVDTFTSLQYQVEDQVIDDGSGTLARDGRRALQPGYSWTYRALDSRVDPRHGYAVTAQVSGASRVAFSDTNFIRTYGRGVRFWSLDPVTPSKAGMFVTTAELGMVWATSSDHIPSDNLFRAGGAQSLRGYAYQSLGVRDGTAVLGGRVMGVASVEYQHPVAKDIWLAAFYDIGNAAESLATWKAVAGYGLGVRVRTPVGPISVDLAYGQADQRWRMHFWIGYPF